MRTVRILLSFLLVAFVAASSHAVTRHVPADFGTIQGAINASSAGDTVVVSPGTYHENINFRGKNIVVASMALLSGEGSYISATVIDGSTPVSPDTSSCVVIASGEDSTAVLHGFTLTGGTGTRWLDKHIGGLYREGGGVLTENSSPTIRFNRIVHNTATSLTGVVSAGGGAIRSDGGNPRILNNVIAYNSGRYGAGIVLNYTGATIRNNIIFANKGGEDYGGSGIWCNQNGPFAKVVENNTIIGNVSALDAGGVLVWSTSVVLWNNIIWDNTQSTGSQIGLRLPSASVTVGYSDIQGGWSGTGNIDEQPAFSDSAFILTPASPCVDAGDPDVSRNDPLDSGNPGNALWPSRGGVRSDMGAYGGPGAARGGEFSEPEILFQVPNVDFGYTLSGNPRSFALVVKNGGAGRLSVDSVSVQSNPGGTIAITSASHLSLGPTLSDTLKLAWSPVTNTLLQDSLLVFHNDPSAPHPVKLPILGNSNPVALLQVNTTGFSFGTININTLRRDTTFYVRNVGTGADSVYVSLDYKQVTQHSSIQAGPAGFSLSAGDSQLVTFTVFPTQVGKTGIFQPLVLIDSRFGLGTTHYEKRMAFSITGTLSLEERDELPRAFRLDQNYPNPFNPSTTIRYGVPASSAVSLKVYNALGQEVAQLVKGVQVAGMHEVTFDANHLASGVYFYQMKAGTFVETRELIVLR